MCFNLFYNLQFDPTVQKHANEVKWRYNYKLICLSTDETGFMNKCCLSIMSVIIVVKRTFLSTNWCYTLGCQVCSFPAQFGLIPFAQFAPTSEIINKSF